MDMFDGVLIDIFSSGGIEDLYSGCPLRQGESVSVTDAGSQISEERACVVSAV